MNLRKQSNSVYFCEYHLVIPTKYRRKIFNSGVFAYLEDMLKRIKDYYPEIDVLEINHDRDHVHILVSIPPKLSVGKVVGIIKANTARELNKKFDFLKQVYWKDNSIWSEGYFVSTIGINEQIIKKYIQQQGQEDFGQTKFELK